MLTALPHWSLRRPIAAALHLVLFGLIRQLSLLREEFRPLKLVLHSELRRRAASRRALPCPSSYALLSVTTQFTSCVQNVHHRRKHMLAFSDIFPKQLGIFSLNFTCLLSVHTYDGGHFEHIMVVALNMA